MLAVGDKVDDFVATGHHGQSIRFYDLLENGPVVLFFFPRAFTPGCMLETRAFAQRTPDFAEHGAAVIGISTDNADRSRDFACSHGADAFPMIADEDGALCRQFGVAGFGGAAKRITFVVGQDKRVLQRTDYAVRATKHVVDALKAVKDVSKA